MDERTRKRQHDWENITGQYHYQNRGNKEDLQSVAARAGWEQAKKFAQSVKKRD